MIELLWPWMLFALLLPWLAYRRAPAVRAGRAVRRPVRVQTDLDLRGAGVPRSV